jgi:hypothetical protein
MSQSPAPPALFLVTSLVDDWADQGPAVIQWSARRDDGMLPWPAASAIADYDELSPAARAAAGRAIARLFTLDEALVAERGLARYVRASARGLELPLTADEALALQSAGPAGSARTLWRITPPAEALPGLTLPIEGIVALWPWPGLEPGEIAPLMALRRRLGRDPLPPRSA